MVRQVEREDIREFPLGSTAELAGINCTVTTESGECGAGEAVLIIHQDAFAGFCEEHLWQAEVTGALRVTRDGVYQIEFAIGHGVRMIVNAVCTDEDGQRFLFQNPGLPMIPMGRSDD